ncbi:hypothetical protein HUT18_07290 [Streptomyces sp. NA04227]|uniref:hypothetical protein n=1 Tax=Streptomyces sp. NA04227 TaxID=2742136 RepID=UPI001592A731|nr:hypothetical protein [Streptomyces sp. NA04227]QKW06236.1 hypothetical protein HUT18_07290 [Streptomyces sp. NA04227]
MNIRSLTRGDGVVIGAAVLLFIASFLDTLDDAGDDAPTAWSNGNLLLSVYLLGIFAAALIVVGRGLPAQRKIAGLELGQIGVAFAVASAWSALGAIFDTDQSFGFIFDKMGGGSSSEIEAGTGLILGLIAALILAAAAVATALVPALSAPLMGAAPAAPQPYGAQPQGGYGYPGPGGAQQAPLGGQPQQPYGAQAGQPQPAAPAPAAPSQGGDFSPFWFAVPVARPLFGEDGSPTPIAELAPGTWYLAVEQRGAQLIAQTQDGRRGVLQDTSGIQRG